jgi:hypothetical protein
MVSDDAMTIAVVAEVDSVCGHTNSLSTGRMVLAFISDAPSGRKGNNQGLTPRLEAF